MLGLCSPPLRPALPVGRCLSLGRGVVLALTLAAMFPLLWPAPLALIVLFVQLSPSSLELWSCPGISSAFWRLAMDGPMV